MQLRLEVGKQERLLERAIGECSLLATSGIGALPFVAKPGNLDFGRTFAVPGPCWKAAIPRNPACHAVSMRQDHAGSADSAFVPIYTIAARRLCAADGRSRRRAPVADRRPGRLNWAESTPTGVASARTGVWAKAGIPVRALRLMPLKLTKINAQEK